MNQTLVQSESWNFCYATWETVLNEMNQLSHNRVHETLYTSRYTRIFEHSGKLPSSTIHSKSFTTNNRTVKVPTISLSIPHRSLIELTHPIP